ncbi:hypothetical protein [Parasedimentitalea psychrophila]|uniref:Pentapeptide MXKDX repeat protein n=1 Tax=Parasedimentitalea psychrophila TaxID=2997337 RepID=A0A9Y2L046_9RHOB|nr:hypothetical protein [Parasedimentitalea psychrophila]WIY25718.1 hypothetical protein QPJ95_01845 [Parasedimentitalea psychrophila]
MLNKTTKLSAAILLTGVLSTSFAWAENNDGNGQKTPMPNQDSPMIHNDSQGMMGMMGMMQMMSQMEPLMEQCTDMMQAMTDHHDMPSEENKG